MELFKLIQTTGRQAIKSPFTSLAGVKGLYCVPDGCSYSMLTITRVSQLTAAHFLTNNVKIAPASARRVATINAEYTPPIISSGIGCRVEVIALNMTVTRIVVPIEPPTRRIVLFIAVP